MREALEREGRWHVRRRDLELVRAVLDGSGLADLQSEDLDPDSPADIPPWDPMIEIVEPQRTTEMAKEPVKAKAKTKAQVPDTPDLFGNA